MAVSRRKFLTVLGGGLILAAGSGAGWVATRDPTNAMEPWRSAGAGESDPRRRALSYAILAPNPHNRQPWRVELVGSNEAVLFCDLDRRLPVTDPVDRQITIGLGGFLELMRVAAAEDGLRADIALFPQGEPAERLDGRPVAHIRFVPDQAVRPDPLFRHVLDRRSNKEAYDTARALPPAVIADLAGAGSPETRIEGTVEAGRVAVLRDITTEGMRTEMHTPDALAESVRLIRIGKAEIEANPDGVDLGGPFFEALKVARLLRQDMMTDTSTSMFDRMVESTLSTMRTSMGYLWMITAGNSRADQIATGRDYLRVNLKATELGIGIQPQSQTLQEFDTMAQLFRRIHGELGATGDERVQMLCRLGYGPAVKPSPRWPAQTRITTA